MSKTYLIFKEVFNSFFKNNSQRSMKISKKWNKSSSYEHYFCKPMKCSLYPKQSILKNIVFAVSDCNNVKICVTNNLFIKLFEKTRNTQIWFIDTFIDL